MGDCAVVSYFPPDGAISKLNGGEEEDDLFIAAVPDGIKTGPEILEQNGQQSNGYLYHVAFAPRDTFVPATQNGGQLPGLTSSASLGHEAGEFMFLNWSIQLNSLCLSLGGLSEGQVVGSGSWDRGFTQDFELTVESLGGG